MQKSKTTKITDKSLFYWAFSGNLKLQILLTVVIVLVVFARVLPLEMQKRIVNDAIALKNLDALILYCVIYLLAITVASGLKLAINYLQAQIGEQAMARMRQELYDHILTLPLGFFRNTQPGMVVSSLMTELSAAGTFAGMAFAVPVTNILTLLAFSGYLLWLNPMLAGATLLIYPVVVFVLPQLQKRANTANKARVDLSRATSSQIAESISGIQEIQVHAAYQQESLKFSRLTILLRNIRIRWSLYRFGIKTASNYFIGLGPFIVFIYGGYLVMHGQLALGAMVAFLSAQEKLFDPWKEMINFYQTYQDAKIRYKRTMEYFAKEPEFALLPAPDKTIAIEGDVEVKNLIFDTADGHRLLNSVSFSLAPGEHLAVVGFSGSGKSTLVQCIGKMFEYSGGSIKLGGQEVKELSKNELIQDLGYVSQHPFIFTGTIEENLLYAWQPLFPETEDKAKAGQRQTLELDRMIQVLQQTGFFLDVMRFGLDAQLAADEEKTIARIIRIRENFRRHAEELKDFIELYSLHGYHQNSSVSENIFFGTSTNPRFSHDILPTNLRFRNFLSREGLLPALLELGHELAAQAVDLLTGLDSSDIFFAKTPVAPDQLARCEKLLQRLQKKNADALKEDDRTYLLALALNFVPARHTMVHLKDSLEQKLLIARGKCRSWCLEIAPDLFDFYSETSYIANQSILHNIFFGKLRSSDSRSQERLNKAIMQVLVEEDFLEDIAKIGMQYQVGTMGDRLSGGQRQKLAIARVLLKDPNIIIMDEATSALDNKSQTRIQRLLERRYKGKKTVMAVVHRLDILNSFDKIAVMKAGKLVEFGRFDELIKARGLLYELVYGRQ